MGKQLFGLNEPRNLVIALSGGALVVLGVMFTLAMVYVPPVSFMQFVGVVVTAVSGILAGLIGLRNWVRCQKEERTELPISLYNKSVAAIKSCVVVTDIPYLLLSVATIAAAAQQYRGGSFAFVLFAAFVNMLFLYVISWVFYIASDMFYEILIRK